MTNVNLSRLRDRIQPDVRVRLDTEFRLDELNQAPGRRLQPVSRAGKLNPALLVFNDTVRSHNVIRMVRRWIIDQHLNMEPRSPQGLAGRIIVEARGRIRRFGDGPLEALATAAVLDTIVYRGSDVPFDALVAQAREVFSARL